MARKSKRMAINEAIRQGQAKIAEGLKTGQMRSDGLSARKVEKDSRAVSGSENTMRSAGKGGAALFRSKEKSAIGRFLSSDMKLVLLLCVVGLFMVIALMAVLMGKKPTGTPDQSRVSMRETGVDEEESVYTPQPNESETTAAAVEENESGEPEETVSPPVVPSGDNVIVIYTIELDRKDILRPVAEFFRGKGIETEIITISGKAALVTKAGFMQNPASRGTDGYGLFQRIKQLGTVYVEEEKDTKFGLKPFQDIYGYKRQ